TYATVKLSAAAFYDLGIALSRDDNKLDQALRELYVAATIDWESALPLAAIAEVQRRRYFLTDLDSWKEQAMASLAQAELRNPDCAEVHRIAGLLEFDGSRPEQAIAHMRRATEFRPPHPDAFYRLGQLYQRNGQLPEALQAYSEVRRLAPRDARNLPGHGQPLQQPIQFRRGIQSLSKSGGTRPRPPGLSPIAGCQLPG